MLTLQVRDSLEHPTRSTVVILPSHRTSPPFDRSTACALCSDASLERPEPVDPDASAPGPTGSVNSLLGGSLAVPGVEPCHAATGIEDLLLTRVERVALGADLRVNRACLRRATCRERRTTGTCHRGLDVLRMYVGLHLGHLLIVGPPGRSAQPLLPQP